MIACILSYSINLLLFGFHLILLTHIELELLLSILSELVSS